jgi:hypothetical protein
MLSTIKGLRGITIASFALLTGCAQLGSAADVLGGVLGAGSGGTGNGGSGQIDGEIRGVDANRQYLQITASNGQTGNVSFDNRTTVVFNNQQYNISSLEAGDYVSMRVYQNQQGQLYTDQIVVQRDVRGGTGSQGTYGSGSSGSVGTGFVRAEGTVGQVDYNRGLFQLRTTYGATYVVSMPYSVAAGDRDVFTRLRSGDYVRVEGNMTGESQMQLSRFVR